MHCKIIFTVFFILTTGGPSSQPPVYEDNSEAAMVSNTEKNRRLFEFNIVSQGEGGVHIGWKISKLKLCLQSVY